MYTIQLPPRGLSKNQHTDRWTKKSQQIPSESNTCLFPARFWHISLTISSLPPRSFGHSPFSLRRSPSCRNCTCSDEQGKPRLSHVTILSHLALIVHFTSPTGSAGALLHLWMARQADERMSLQIHYRRDSRSCCHNLRRRTDLHQLLFHLRILQKVSVRSWHWIATGCPCVTLNRLENSQSTPAEKAVTTSRQPSA